MKNSRFFEKIDSEQKAYWLGFLYADGSVSGTSNAITVHLSQADDQHLQKFARVFDRPVYRYTYWNDSKNIEQKSSILQICNKHTHADLISHDILPRKTYLDSSKVFDHVKQDLMCHFVRGYFDGDGCISGHGKKVSFNFAGGQRFLERLQEILCDSLGFSKTSIVSGKGVKVLTWSGKDQVTLMRNWLYTGASVWMDRKKNKFDSLSKNLSQRGSSRYRGVVWYPRNQKWLASISHLNKRLNLGYYEDEIDAAKAYDAAVVNFNKPFYKLNFQRSI